MLRRGLIPVWIGIFSLCGMFLLGQEGWIPAGPTIVIDEVSPYGDPNGQVAGHLENANPSDYAVACYIEVEGVLWTKPTDTSPHTSIDPDGTWTVDIATGGNDLCATKVYVYLVPVGAEPVICGPCSGVPSLPEAVSSDMADRTPAVRTISFAGDSWKVKSSPVCPVGPGPNYFSDRAEDVYLNENGELVLSIKHVDGKWQATEVVNSNSYGYGTYLVVFNSRLDQLDANEIGAAFTWDTGAPEASYREIDFVEVAKWGNPANPTNAQFVVQPCSACPECGDRCSRFQVDLTDEDKLVTLFVVWQPGEAQFRLYRGDWFSTTPPPGALIHEWAKVGGVPEPGEENVRFNFWLLNGQAPLEGLDRELVIRNFGFSPEIKNFGDAAPGPDKITVP